MFNHSLFIVGKKKKALTNITLLASQTLSKAAFLCGVLLEEYDCWHLAFKVGMFGLELPRPPASCKALEVSLGKIGFMYEYICHRDFLVRFEKDLVVHTQKWPLMSKKMDPNCLYL